ncbi:MAG: precorrin-6y C5,15-methyltransferase (decarboxylating) subunit CbiE [Nitrospinota bacterium]
MGKRVCIIGCGPGDTDLITLKGKRAIEEADVIAGSRRLLTDFVKGDYATTIILENNYQDILEEVDRIRKDKRVAFLVSGDPLLYSLGESIIKRFGRDNCEVIPGISSFQYAFCQLKESWRDYRVFSLHGNKDMDLNKTFKENERFILLLDPKQNLKFIKGTVKLTHEQGYTFYVASNLSMPTENISRVSFEDLDSFPEESLSILIVRRGDE